MRQQAAAVDVADDDDGQFSRPGEAHVGQIRCPQVDFGRRARAFADDSVELASQRGEFGCDHVGEPGAMSEVVGGAHRTGDLPADDELRRPVAARLEQDRVEPHAGRQPRRPGLHRLCAADLAAVDGDRRVVRHVLRLERRDANSLARQQPTQSRHDHRLARVGGGARDQQRAAHVFSRDRHSANVRISAPSSVTTRVCSNCAVHFLSTVATVQPSSQIS